MSIDAVLGRALALVCAALLTAEIFLLLTGVIARYVFLHPLPWSDELAGTMFLWGSMLGAVLALRGAAHMRMTALVGRTSGALREALEAAQLCAVALVLGCALAPAIDYVQDEQIVMLSTMDISIAWRASAMPVGIGLMLVSLLLRLRPRLHWPSLAGAGATLALAGVLLLLEPVFQGLGNANLAVFFVVGIAAAAGGSLPFRPRSPSASPRSAISACPPISRCPCWPRAWTRACRTRCCCPYRCSCSSAC